MYYEALKQLSIEGGPIVAIVIIIVSVAWYTTKVRLDAVFKINNDVQKDLLSIKKDVDDIKSEYMSNAQLKEHLELILKPLYMKIEGVAARLEVQVKNLEQASSQIAQYKVRTN